MRLTTVVNRGKKQLNWLYRLNTSNLRVLPDLIIIGAQKAGTTSLFYYLSQHPQLVPAIKKEIHYFDGGLDPNHDDFLRGEDWYRAHFPKMNEINKTDLTFEATPSYLFHPDVPGRIHDLLPNVKMIALLRNPTERAISQYFHDTRKNREFLPIMDALRAEEERLKLIFENKDFKNPAFFRFSYKLRGHYYDQIIRYLNYFDRNNVLILNSDHFFNDTLNVLKKIYEFLNLKSNLDGIDLQPKHVSKNKIKVDQEVYQYLNDYFLPHNKKLYDLLGENYNW
jgi:hypothetical protein